MMIAINLSFAIDKLSLPENLAVPFYGITELLGIQPILGHIDLALANWSLKNPSGPYDFDGDWFCIIPFMVELTFAKCLKDFVEILNLLNVAGGSNPRNMLRSTLENKIAQHLDEITKVINLMKTALSRTHDHLDAKIFFNQVRPFLAGWGGEGNPMPDGLVYEGVSATPIKMLGGSAAQSSTLQALDSLLGVEHVTGHKGFIVKMRSFMAPEHKRFIEYLENRKYSLRHLVQSAETDILLSSYNNCLSALIQLRTYHIQIVSKYVVVVSKEMNEGTTKV
ncbi:hypothetical protein Btru_066432 [Bulinus truncatus]|nr:hypothetical protein Btru_066432 [Bulinus truncatus]